MNEAIYDNMQNDADETLEIERVELPMFEFGSSEAEKMKILEETINQLPIDEQEHYWQIMDNEELGIGEKINLINDLLNRYNGDIKD